MRNGEKVYGQAAQQQAAQQQAQMAREVDDLVQYFRGQGAASVTAREVAEMIPYIWRITNEVVKGRPKAKRWYDPETKQTRVQITQPGSFGGGAPKPTAPPGKAGPKNPESYPEEARGLIEAMSGDAGSVTDTQVNDLTHALGNMKLADLRALAQKHAEKLGSHLKARSILHLSNKIINKVKEWQVQQGGEQGGKEVAPEEAAPQPVANDLDAANAAAAAAGEQEDVF